MLAQFHLAHHAANAGQGFVASIRAARSHAPCSIPQCDGSRTNAKRCVPYAARATCNIFKRDSLRSVQHTARTLTSASISSAASTSASAKTSTCHAPVVVSVACCALRAAWCTCCVLRRYTSRATWQNLSHVVRCALPAVQFACCGVTPSKVTWRKSRLRHRDRAAWDTWGIADRAAQDTSFHDSCEIPKRR